MQAGNQDSFYYTNIGPQHEKFNQGKELWLGLEDFVLENTTASRKRVSVFNGPIFTNQDNMYRGVPIPKVRVGRALDKGTLACVVMLACQRQPVLCSSALLFVTALGAGPMALLAMAYDEM